MIEFHYRIDLKKDHRNLEALNINELTRAEASDFLHVIEKVKLEMLLREFGADFEIKEDKDETEE